MKKKREYLSSVTLMILHDDCDPNDITELLKIKSSDEWRKGDVLDSSGRKRSPAPWSGWKRFLPDSFYNKPIERQFKYWIKKLDDRKKSIRKLNDMGYYCTLDCFIVTRSAVSITIPCKMQRQIADLKLELRISCQVSQH